MKQSRQHPAIPGVLQPVWERHEQFRENYARWQSANMEYFDTREPSVELCDDGRYAVVLPNDGETGNRGNVMVYSFANGLTPFMVIQSLIVADALPKEDPLLILPQSTRKAPARDLTAEELSRVSSGDMRPITSRQARIVSRFCNEFGLEKLGVISGYSFGATNAAGLALAVAGDIEVGALDISEPANVEERTVRKIKRDFKSDGLGNFITAINDSALPLFTEMQHARGGIDTLRMLGLLAGYARDGGTEENRAIVNLMARNSLAWDLHVATLYPAETSVSVSHMGKSKISKPDAIKAAISQYEAQSRRKVTEILVPGYGHSGSNNLAVQALLTRAAFDAAATSD